MKLDHHLDLPIEINRHGAVDSILISVKAPNSKAKTISIKPNDPIIYEDPYFVSESKLSKQNRNWFRKTGLAIINSFFWTLILISCLFVGLNLTGVAEGRIVMTGSMQPNINPGDMIFAVSDNYLDPKRGDVVIYEAKRFDGEVVAPFAHRIIGGDAEKGWITKGDANPQADVQQPSAADITGVVVLTIPNVGLLFDLRTLIFLSVIVISIYLTKEILRGNDD